MIKGIIHRLLQPVIDECIEDALTKDSKNIERFFRKKAMESSASFIRDNMKNALSMNCKIDVLNLGLQKSKKFFTMYPDALLCEFGVASGTTINHIASQVPRNTVYGFDSFEGLPEDWRDGYPKGSFSRSAPPSVADNVELVKGYFDQTLLPFLDEHPGPAAFLHIDCDLYSSTATIFQAFEQRLRPGSVLVFDEYFNYPDWEQGEHRALVEYLQRSGLGVAYLGYCKTHQQVAAQLVALS